MGGSAGHMAHPFDCREVRNGRDLINFYVKAVNSIPLYQGEMSRDEWLADFGGVNPSSVKFDGVNASFRLEKTNTSAGFMFVHDRGAASDKSDVGKIDYKGITSDNAHERFPSKPFEPETNEQGEQVCPEDAEIVNVDGKMMCSKQHGMIHVVEIMSKILNHDLMKVKPYIEALGIFENGIGPEGVTFNAEFYSNEDPEKDIKSIKNVTDYNQNFIAIHNLQDFHTEEKVSARGKVATSRKTRGYYWQTQEELQQLFDQKDQLQAQRQDTVEIDTLIGEKNQDLYRRQNEHQEIINKFAEALADNANALDLPFNVHTQVGLQFKEGLTREIVIRRIEEALETKVPYNYEKIDDNTSIGPTAINEQTNEVEPRKLGDLLLQIKENPAHAAYFPDEFKKTKKDGTRKPELAAIKVSSDFSKRHASPSGKLLNTKQSAFAVKLYTDIIVDGPHTGIGVGDVAGDADKSFEAINSAVILWHAVRLLGNVLKESVLSKVDFGLPMSEQEGIVIQSEKMCDGIPFKFTGEFIVQGRESPHRKDAPPQINEVKLKYGELLERFVVEQEDVPAEEKRTQYVVLVPGGFKPPTGGHYSMIRQYEERPDVAKVIVVTGFKPRTGQGMTITYQQSKAIFDLYGGFGDKVEFRDQGPWPTPMRTCYELMNDERFISEFHGAVFALGASDKDDDEARIGEFANYFQNNPTKTGVQVASAGPAKALEVRGEAASASRMRKAFIEGDWELFKELLPDDNFYDDVVQILNGQVTNIVLGQGEEQVNENFFSADSLFSLVDDVLLEYACKSGKKWTVCSHETKKVIPTAGKFSSKGAAKKRAAQMHAHSNQESLKQKEKNVILTEREDEALNVMLNKMVQDALKNKTITNLPEFIKSLTGDAVEAVLAQFQNIAPEEVTGTEEPTVVSQIAEEEPLEEISAMGAGGAGGGAVEGAGGGWINDKKRINAGI